ncbi:hypothetical protein EYF80_059868 [Liparis tanakae]|uniref:Uncharacterized protein n=1 Tax=Liparis tanakae TaxID=230148 RepID=A0A4Z2ENL9_9TELE|nr:hypothetical protein EYF80_059868 [Liparis tanakae]
MVHSDIPLPPLPPPPPLPLCCRSRGLLLLAGSWLLLALLLAPPPPSYSPHIPDLTDTAWMYLARRHRPPHLSDGGLGTRPLGPGRAAERERERREN